MTTSQTLTLAFVPKLVAKEEAADELATFLADAVTLANDERGTVVWFALRTDPTTFWIVDAFANEADRQAHLAGRIAARLLAAPPEILPADVLAAKVP